MLLRATAGSALRDATSEQCSQLALRSTEARLLHQAVADLLMRTGPDPPQLRASATARRRVSKMPREIICVLTVHVMNEIPRGRT